MPPSGDPVTARAEVFTALPDPGQANSVADLVVRLRLLKVWAGDPSYEMIKDRVNDVVDARRAGRPVSWRASPPWRIASGPVGGG